jgi:predicted ATPase/DNA-binding XRE family transcriptional regulator
MQPHSFGDWLKHRRKALDLTQAELASQVGCSAAAIRKIEAEERRPSAQIAERLAEIFAIPPNERTNFLRFARGELRSAPAETKENFPWHTATKSPRSNLPATVTSLVGREQEIALIREYLLNPDIRLVSLIGPPGIGKTRLSIEAARAVLTDFPDGVFFAALAPLEDPSLLARTVAQALGFVETKREPSTEPLIEGIGDKQMLVLLDNCEHLIEEVASLASALLSTCSQLKILATSRESLRIPGEWIYAISTLSLPKEISLADIHTASEFPALTLFAERARAVRADFVLANDNIQAVASICAQLDGLPLAIELIAARMRLMTPQALLEHWNNQYVLSADGMRSLSARQKTLNDAIAWSYNLLSAEEQRLFACLSIFSGGFSVDIVETIFSELFVGRSLSNLITSLLDKSLLQRTFDARGQVRFNMLVTIRQFALDRLQNMGSEADARNKHLVYFLNLAAQADKEIHGPNQVTWLRRLSSERDNLRSALSWATETRQTEVALQMVGHLSLFWFRRANLSEGRQWLGQALMLPDAPQYHRLYSYALAQLAFHTWLQIGPKEARPFIEQALSVARAHADEWNTAWALTVKGLVLIAEESFEAAQSTLEESKRRFRSIHDEWGYANAIISLANGAYHQDDQVTELALHKESLFLFRKLGDKYFESVALRFIGMLQLKQGDVNECVAALREALLLAQQLDSQYEIAAGLRHIGNAAQTAGTPARAVHLCWASRNILDSIGAWQQEAEAEFARDLAACRAALDEVTFAAAEQAGRAMTMEQAIAYALEDQD